MRFNFYHTSVATKIFSTAFFMVVFCCFALALTMLFALLAYPDGIHYVQAALSTPTISYASILKILQSAQTIGLFVLPTLIMVYLFEPEGFAFLKFQRKTFVTVLLFTALLVFICSPVINILANFNQKLQLPANWAGLQGWIENSEHEASILTETFLFTSSLSGLFLNILIMAILPAIGEELLFRGLLQQYFNCEFINIF